MKMLMLGSLLVFSNFANAAFFNCSEKNTSLTVDTDTSVVKAHLISKFSRAGATKLFGKEVPSEVGIFKIKTYELSDKWGSKATLKISEVPLLSRLPGCGRRLCDDLDHPVTKVKVMAELDYQGNVTDYECSKTFNKI